MKKSEQGTRNELAKHARGEYTQEFKMEAVRLVKVGDLVDVTAKMVGVPKASLSDWVRASKHAGLSEAGDKPVTPKQMELVRLQAELARMTMGRDIAKEAAK